jgi:virulence-associated protein VapD
VWRKFKGYVTPFVPNKTTLGETQGRFFCVAQFGFIFYFRNTKMYALAFDMEIAKLKENYGEPYNLAYDEIRKTLDNLGFSWVQGSLYLARSDMNSLTAVYKAIETLKKIDWFKKSVRDIRAFKIEDWSDLTK